MVRMPEPLVSAQLISCSTAAIAGTMSGPIKGWLVPRSNHKSSSTQRWSVEPMRRKAPLGNPVEFGEEVLGGAHVGGFINSMLFYCLPEGFDLHASLPLGGFARVRTLGLAVWGGTVSASRSRMLGAAR